MRQDNGNSYRSRVRIAVHLTPIYYPVTPTTLVYLYINTPGESRYIPQKLDVVGNDAINSNGREPTSYYLCQAR